MQLGQPRLQRPQRCGVETVEPLPTAHLVMVTVIIAGIVLFQYGSGPIKGFAVMLMIGIVTSLFTGVFCSKVAMDWLVRGARVKRLKVG